MGLGMYALQIADAGLRKSGIIPDPVKPDDTLADIPVVKAFVVRYPTAGAESIQRFYDAYNKNKTYFATFQAKAEEGDVAAMQHVMAMGGARIFVQLDTIKAALASQADFVRKVNKNREISSAEKRQLIDTAYLRMTEVARAGLDAMRQVDAVLNAAPATPPAPLPPPPAPAPQRSAPPSAAPYVPSRQMLRQAGFSEAEINDYIRRQAAR